MIIIRFLVRNQIFILFIKTSDGLLSSVLIHGMRVVDGVSAYIYSEFDAARSTRTVNTEYLLNDLWNTFNCFTLPLVQMRLPMN